MDLEFLKDALPLELADLIGQMHGVAAAAHRILLRTVAILDDEGTSRQDGAHTTAAWLSFRLGISPATATEWVRIAHVLEQLPRIAATYEEGRICLDQPRSLVAIAIPETDAELAERAARLSATQLAALAATAGG
ncbi:MAG: DUF222 domain-containing protein [Actinomycetota bacterium]